jgi:hypothetical protein
MSIFYFKANRTISNCIFSEWDIRSSCYFALSFLYYVTDQYKVWSLFSQCCLLLFEGYIKRVAVVLSETLINFTGLKDVPKRVLLTVTVARPSNSKWFFVMMDFKCHFWRKYEFIQDGLLLPYTVWVKNLSRRCIHLYLIQAAYRWRQYLPSQRR